MAERYVLALAQDMTISRDAFLRALPGAVDHAPFGIDGGDIRPLDPERRWRIALGPLPDLCIGMITLPRQRVEVFLADCSADETRRFLERFELYYRRGGG